MPLNTSKAYVRLQDESVSRSLRIAAVAANEAPSRFAERVLWEVFKRRGYYGEVVKATPATGKEGKTV